MLLVAFVVIEHRAAHPLLPLRVVLDRNRGGSFLASLLVGTAMLGTFLSLTYYFQGTLHYSALKSGFAFVPFSLGIITGATLASRLLPRFGPAPVMGGGLALAAAGLVLFSTLDVHSSYVAIVLPAEIIVSLGMGLSFVAMSSTALIGREPRGRRRGQRAGQRHPADRRVDGRRPHQHHRHHGHGVLPRRPRHLGGRAKAGAIHGYTTAFTFSAIVLAVAAVAAFTLIRRGRPATADAEPEAEAREPLVAA